jgi:hypothetical protein
MDGKWGFRQELVECLKTLPAFHLRARQTRLTPYSLQVLVDTSDDITEHFRRIQDWPETILNMMDLVIEGCHRARGKLSKRQQEGLNINRAPIPLHLTLVRFGPDTTTQQRSAAEEWCSKYRRQIWGWAKDIPIVLAQASKSPYYDTRSVRIR